MCLFYILVAFVGISQIPQLSRDVYFYVCNLSHLIIQDSTFDNVSASVPAGGEW